MDTEIAKMAFGFSSWMLVTQLTCCVYNYNAARSIFKNEWSCYTVIVQLMNTTYFLCIFFKNELEPAIVWKLVTCQRITSKGTRPWWVKSEPAIRSGDTCQWIPCFDSCQLVTTWMCNIRLHSDRKCEIKHCFPCGADRRSSGRSVYGHVITHSPLGVDGFHVHFFSPCPLEFLSHSPSKWCHTPFTKTAPL